MGGGGALGFDGDLDAARVSRSVGGKRAERSRVPGAGAVETRRDAGPGAGRSFAGGGRAGRGASGGSGRQRGAEKIGRYARGFAPADASSADGRGRFDFADRLREPGEFAAGAEFGSATRIGVARGVGFSARRADTPVTGRNFAAVAARLRGGIAVGQSGAAERGQNAGRRDAATRLGCSRLEGARVYAAGFAGHGFAVWIGACRDRPARKSGGGVEAGRGLGDRGKNGDADAQYSGGGANGHVLDAAGGRQPAGAKHVAAGTSKSGNSPGSFAEGPYLHSECTLPESRRDRAFLRSVRRPGACFARSCERHGDHDLPAE